MAVGPTLTNASKYELRNKSWETPGVLAAAGCQVSIITDSPVIPEHYLPLCAGMAVKAGMDPFQALQAITINPAKHIGLEDRIGSLEEGKDADIVVTDGCPFEVATEVRYVLIDGNVVKEEDIGFLPLYTGMPAEETQGLCIGTENYLAVNCKVSEEKQQQALDFLEWLYTSEKGKDYVINKLNFIAPYTSFGVDEMPTDPLARSVSEWMTKSDVKNIPWTFLAFPSDNFKNDFGSALLEYAQGSKKWEDVVQTVIDSWKNERS